MSVYIASEKDALGASKNTIQIYAEELANELNYRYSNLKEVTTEIGIITEFSNPLIEKDDFNGSMIVNKETKEIIISLSSLTSELRNNFTIAHELGHLFLHSKRIRKQQISFGRYGTNRLEWEANWFAAAFLMPKYKFKTKNKEFNGNNYELSIYFNVSESAIKVRKKELGI